jgi:hypothetical protein
MASSVRFLTSPNATLRHFSGRSYVADSAGIVDVPYTDADAIHSAATAGAPLRRLIEVGATSDRPANNPGVLNRPPAVFFDTTLSAPVFWTGSGWVDVTGTPA